MSDKPFDWGFGAKEPDEPELPPTEALTPPTPPTDPDWEGEPTQAFAFKPPTAPVAPTPAPVWPANDFRPPSQYPAPVVEPTPVADLPWQQAPVEEPVADAPASSLDALFGESQFREYHDSVLPTEVPFRSADRAPRAPLSTPQRVLMSIAGGLIAVLALVAIFFGGTHLTGLFKADAAPVASSPPTPTPTPTIAAGPVAPGEHQWNELAGTECLEPFTSAWEQKYSVVDCAGEHGGQLAAKGTFDTGAVSAFPGADALAAKANLACADAKVIDYKKAGAYSDIQITASYATTALEWTNGFRSYYCFVNRTSGDPIVGTVARKFGTAAG